MTALLWDDIQGDLVSAKKHFAQAVALYVTGVGDYLTSMAFQHAMQSGYTSFEAAMKRLLHLIDEPLPRGMRVRRGHRPAHRRLGGERLCRRRRTLAPGGAERRADGRLSC